MAKSHRHLIHRQPAKALPYFLRLRKPHVFDLIREHNLFTAVRDQALLLVDFDQQRAPPPALATTTALPEKRDGQDEKGKHGAAIQLLVDHTHSIPVRSSSVGNDGVTVLILLSQIDRVVSQLDAKPKYLYMYLDALFDKDPQFSLPYSDRMVRPPATIPRTHVAVNIACGFSWFQTEPP